MNIRGIALFWRAMPRFLTFDWRKLVIVSKTCLSCVWGLFWSGDVSHRQFPHATTATSTETYRLRIRKRTVSFGQDTATPKDGVRTVSRHRFLPHDYRQQPVPTARLDTPASGFAVSIAWHVGIGCDRCGVGVESHHRCPR